jgi:hypothetical protein
MGDHDGVAQADEKAGMSRRDHQLGNFLVRDCSYCASVVIGPELPLDELEARLRF